MIAHPSNTFIVTSRPFGYRKNPLSRVTVLEVSPFTIDQVRKFISNWYIANEIMDRQKDNEGVRLIAFHGAEDLIRRLRNTPALLELAVNPLLLTMIATVHKYKNSLPGRRIDLYAEICDVFLGKIQLARGLTLDLTPTQKQIVLQTLAYEMMKLKTRMIEAPQASKIIKESLRRVGPQYTEIEFLKMIEDSSGILLEREVGVYSFAHLTFQEYLAAAYIKGQPTNKILIDNIDNSWWHETIRLYAAQGDATSIIDACLVNEDLSSAMLTLAIQCIDEAGQVSQEARIRLENVLSVGLDDSNTQLMIAETLLSIRVSSMHRISESKYIDRLPITNAEYQLFINEQGFYYVPDTWKGENYKKGSGRNVVTGIRPNDAESFCRWLSAKFAGEWYFRLPTLDELHNEFNEVNYRHPDLLRGYWCKEVDNNYTFFSIDSPVDINIENIYQLIQKDTNVFKLHGINLINYVNKMQTSLDIKNLRQIQGLTNLVNLFNRIDELKKIDINIKLIDKILTHIGDKKDAFDIEIIYFDVEDLDRKMPLNSMEKKDYIRILLVTLEKIIKYTYNRDFWNSCHNHLYDTKNVCIDRIITLDKILLDIDKKKIFIKKSGLETHKKLEQDYNLVCQGDFNFIEKNAEIIVKQDASVSNIFYADRIKK